jgi:signal transduction histidine kinase
MEVSRVGTDPPRPPLSERITPVQWVAVDIALAGLFLLGALAHLYRGLDVGPAVTESLWVLGPLYVVATVPIAFRRRWPELSLIFIVGAVTATTMLGYSLAPVPLIAFPLYSVTVKYSRRQSLVVLVVVEALSILALSVAAILRPIEDDVTFNVFLAIAIWFVGDSVRTRRVYKAGLMRQSEQEQRRELDRAHQATVEERLEIARELHDVIAHSLSVIAIQSGVGRHVIDTQP